MLRLVKMEEKYIPQLFEMMEEWTQAGEEIIPGPFTNAIIAIPRSISPAWK